jgi:hypothetical protein
MLKCNKSPHGRASAQELRLSIVRIQAPTFVFDISTSSAQPTAMEVGNGLGCNLTSVLCICSGRIAPVSSCMKKGMIVGALSTFQCTSNYTALQVMYNGPRKVAGQIARCPSPPNLLISVPGNCDKGLAGDMQFHSELAVVVPADYFLCRWAYWWRTEEPLSDLMPGDIESRAHKPRHTKLHSCCQCKRPRKTRWKERTMIKLRAKRIPNTANIK